MPRESHPWAKVLKSASIAARFASKARAPAMLNQSMADGNPVISRDFPYEVPFCSNGIFCFCQRESTRNTTYVCINNNPFSQTKSTPKDNVGRFSADSWQRCQFLNRLRNFPVKLVNEFTAATVNVFGLCSIESCCFHGIFKF